MLSLQSLSLLLVIIALCVYFNLEIPCSLELFSKKHHLCISGDTYL